MPRIRLFFQAEGCIYVDATESVARSLRNVPRDVQVGSVAFFRRLKDAGLSMDPTIARRLDWTLGEVSLVDDEEGR